MQIHFCLDWHKEGAPLRRAFKFKEALSLFEYYQKLLSRFSLSKIEGRMPHKSKKPGTLLWLCSLTEPVRKDLSSEDLAQEIKKMKDQGISHWCIAMGGASGFTKKDLDEMKPDFIWKLGPLTLPHELASVIAIEQIYRASTILAGHPYHLGH